MCPFPKLNPLSLSLKRFCLLQAMPVIFISPVLLPLFLFFTIFNGISAITCKPFLCGDLNISYPFWVRTNGNEYCGYPGFELTCDSSNKTALLHLLSDVYSVTNIDYESKSLSLVDPDLTQTDCPRPRHNVTFNTSSLFSYGKTIANLTFLFNCSDAIINSLGSYIHTSLTCLESRSLFSFVVDGLVEGLNWNGLCSESVVVPVLESELKSGSLAGSGYEEIVKLGFQLGWTSAGYCSHCEEIGGCCGENTVTNTFVCFEHGRKSRKVLKISLVLSGATGMIILVVLLLFISRSISGSRSTVLIWKRSKSSADFEKILKDYRTQLPKRYSYSDIKRMTNFMKGKLGEGGYGNVFKGQLLDGSPVAIKILNDTKGKGDDFINEVATIGRTAHVNIVRLIGFCCEGSRRALIYEFMPNGSLEKFIFAENPKGGPLGWENLFKIALGIARGLEYLHRGCNTPILHFDIKPHNILLDQDFCPKISDFGLAKLCPDKKSTVSMTRARGTMGYIAPELLSRTFGMASNKSDVYSYGMLLLEMVGGRKNVDAQADNASEIYFPDWIYNRLDERSDLQLGEIKKQSEGEIAQKMIIVGLWCIQAKPVDRPTMSKVIEMLEGNLDGLQIPPKP